ncbi:DUF5074 domain-containing protein [Echinicola rosea]|nr:DUF5074 domain-containing protein [Echinicola rosea]
MKKYKWLYLALVIGLILSSCREEESIAPPEKEELPQQEVSYIEGFYLLNEGNMNMNKASLDYYDYASGVYSRNVYGAANPFATLGLGDVGNDIGVYGDKLYAVINCSNKVEVMDVATTERIQVLDSKNCRYVAFANGYAYISAYDGEVSLGPDKPNGFIAKYDTTHLELVDQIEVGRQPEEMAISNGKLYIANSGGYSPPHYENTISVIDLDSFQKIRDIHVAINLHRVRADGHGNIYVSSRGDYYDIPSDLYIIDAETDAVTHEFDLSCANLDIQGDTAYVIGSEFSYYTGQWTTHYSMINTQTKEVLAEPFIPHELIEKIKTPYGVAVDPVSKNIYITDAGDYVSPGRLYAYNPTSDSLLFEQVTGDIPAHFAFVSKKNTKF